MSPGFAKGGGQEYKNREISETKLGKLTGSERSVPALEHPIVTNKTGLEIFHSMYTAPYTDIP